MRRTRRSSHLALAAALALAGCRERSEQRDAGSAEPPPPRAAADGKPVRIIYPAAPGSFVDLVANLTPSVVHIASTTKVSGGPASLFPDGQADYALGSGILLDTEGYVLTNDHVIANAPELRVRLWDQIELAATVVGRDSKLDIALLKIDGSGRYKPARLGDSDQLQVGEWIAALGNPFGDEVTVTAGVVSATGRTAQDEIAGRPFSFRSLLRTDADVNAGNSGGPLVNVNGEVVGIATAIAGQGGSRGFAIPISRIKHLLPMLRREGTITRAWLGVFIHPVTEEVARERRLETVTGALVSDVVPGSPAAKAGVRPGDVILRFDNRDIDHRSLPWISATSGVGRRIPVTLWRDGGQKQIEVVSERMPE
jgi:serine protease Do